MEILASQNSCHMLVRSWCANGFWELLAAESTGQWYTGFLYNFEQLLAAIRHPSPVGWPLLLFAMMVFPWLMFLNRDMDPEPRVRVILAFIGVFTITAAFGINEEVRTFIPCVSLLAAGTFAAWHWHYPRRVRAPEDVGTNAR